MDDNPSFLQGQGFDPLLLKNPVIRGQFAEQIRERQNQERTVLAAAAARNREAERARKEREAAQKAIEEESRRVRNTEFEGLARKTGRPYFYGSDQEFHWVDDDNTWESQRLATAREAREAEKTATASRLNEEADLIKLGAEQAGTPLSKPEDLQAEMESIAQQEKGIAADSRLRRPIQEHLKQRFPDSHQRKAAMERFRAEGLDEKARKHLQTIAPEPFQEIEAAKKAAEAKKAALSGYQERKLKAQKMAVEAKGGQEPPEAPYQGEESILGSLELSERRGAIERRGQELATKAEQLNAQWETFAKRSEEEWNALKAQPMSWDETIASEAEYNRRMSTAHTSYQLRMEVLKAEEDQIRLDEEDLKKSIEKHNARLPKPDAAKPVEATTGPSSSDMSTIPEERRPLVKAETDRIRQIVEEAAEGRAKALEGISASVARGDLTSAEGMERFRKAEQELRARQVKAQDEVEKTLIAKLEAFDSSGKTPADEAELNAAFAAAGAQEKGTETYRRLLHSGKLRPETAQPVIAEGRRSELDGIVAKLAKEMGQMYKEGQDLTELFWEDTDQIQGWADVGHALTPEERDYVLTGIAQQPKARHMGAVKQFATLAWRSGASNIASGVTGILKAGADAEQKAAGSMIGDSDAAKRARSQANRQEWKADLYDAYTAGPGRLNMDLPMPENPSWRDYMKRSPAAAAGILGYMATFASKAGQLVNVGAFADEEYEWLESIETRSGKPIDPATKIAIAAITGVANVGVETIGGVMGKINPLSKRFGTQMIKDASRRLIARTLLGTVEEGVIEEPLQQIMGRAVEDAFRFSEMDVGERETAGGRAYVSDLAPLVKSFPEWGPSMVILAAFGAAGQRAQEKKAAGQEKAYVEAIGKLGEGLQAFTPDILTAYGIDPKEAEKILAVGDPTVRMERFLKALEKRNPDQPASQELAKKSQETQENLQKAAAEAVAAAAQPTSAQKTTAAAESALNKVRQARSNPQSMAEKIGMDPVTVTEAMAALGNDSPGVRAVMDHVANLSAASHAAEDPGAILEGAAEAANTMETAYQQDVAKMAAVLDEQKQALAQIRTETAERTQAEQDPAKVAQIQAEGQARELAITRAVLVAKLLTSSPGTAPTLSAAEENLLKQPIETPVGPVPLVRDIDGVMVVSDAALDEAEAVLPSVKTFGAARETVAATRATEWAESQRRREEAQAQMSADDALPVSPAEAVTREMWRGPVTSVKSHVQRLAKAIGTKTAREELRKSLAKSLAEADQKAREEEKSGEQRSKDKARRTFRHIGVVRLARGESFESLTSQQKAAVSESSGRGAAYENGKLADWAVSEARTRFDEFDELSRQESLKRAIVEISRNANPIIGVDANGALIINEDRLAEMDPVEAERTMREEITHLAQIYAERSGLLTREEITDAWTGLAETEEGRALQERFRLAYYASRVANLERLRERHAGNPEALAEIDQRERDLATGKGEDPHRMALEFNATMVQDRRWQGEVLAQMSRDRGLFAKVAALLEKLGQALRDMLGAVAVKSKDLAAEIERQITVVNEMLDRMEAEDVGALPGGETGMMLFSPRLGKDAMRKADGTPYQSPRTAQAAGTKSFGKGNYTIAPVLGSDGKARGWEVVPVDTVDTSAVPRKTTRTKPAKETQTAAPKTLEKPKPIPAKPNPSVDMARASAEYVAKKAREGEAGQMSLDETRPGTLSHEGLTEAAIEAVTSGQAELARVLTQLASRYQQMLGTVGQPLRALYYGEDLNQEFDARSEAKNATITTEVDALRLLAVEAVDLAETTEDEALAAQLKDFLRGDPRIVETEEGWFLRTPTIPNQLPVNRTLRGGTEGIKPAPDGNGYLVPLRRAEAAPQSPEFAPAEPPLSPADTQRRTSRAAKDRRTAADMQSAGAVDFTPAEIGEPYRPLPDRSLAELEGMRKDLVAERNRLRDELANQENKPADPEAIKARLDAIKGELVPINEQISAHRDESTRRAGDVLAARQTPPVPSGLSPSQIVGWVREGKSEGQRQARYIGALKHLGAAWAREQGTMLAAPDRGGMANRQEKTAALATIANASVFADGQDIPTTGTLLMAPELSSPSERVFWDVAQGWIEKQKKAGNGKLVKMTPAEAAQQLLDDAQSLVVRAEPGSLVFSPQEQAMARQNGVDLESMRGRLAQEVNERRHALVTLAKGYFDGNKKVPGREDGYTTEEAASMVHILLTRQIDYFPETTDEDGKTHPERFKTSRLDATNQHVGTAFSGEIAAACVEKIREGVPAASSYAAALKDVALAHQAARAAAKGRKAGWRVFPQSDSPEAAQELMDGAAGSEGGWCTGRSLGFAKTHRSGGDFHIWYDESGAPRIAIRMEGDEVGEVSGSLPDQHLRTNETAIAVSYLEEKKLNGGAELISDAKRLREWEAYVAGKAPLSPKLCSLEATEDGGMKFSFFASRNHVRYGGTPLFEPGENHLRELQDASKNWGNVVEVGGNAYIRGGAQVPALQTIGGAANILEGAQVPALQTIGGNAYIRGGAQVPALQTIGGAANILGGAQVPALQTVGGAAYILEGAQVPALQTVGGNAYILEGAQVPALQTVGGAANIRGGAQVPALQTIGGYADIRGGAQVPALQTVGGNAYIREGAQVPALQTIGGYANIRGGAQVPALQTIGGYADIRGGAQVPALQTVGGNAYIREGAQVPALQTIGGNVYILEGAQVDRSKLRTNVGREEALRGTPLDLARKEAGVLMAPERGGNTARLYEIEEALKHLGAEQQAAQERVTYDPEKHLIKRSEDATKGQRATIFKAGWTAPGWFRDDATYWSKRDETGAKPTRYVVVKAVVTRHPYGTILYAPDQQAPELSSGDAAKLKSAQFAPGNMARQIRDDELDDLAKARGIPRLFIDRVTSLFDRWFETRWNASEVRAEIADIIEDGGAAEAGLRAAIDVHQSMFRAIYGDQPVLVIRARKAGEYSSDSPRMAPGYRVRKMPDGMWLASFSDPEAPLGREIARQLLSEGSVIEMVAAYTDERNIAAIGAIDANAAHRRAGEVLLLGTEPVVSVVATVSPGSNLDAAIDGLLRKMQREAGSLRTRPGESRGEATNTRSRSLGDRRASLDSRLPDFGGDGKSNILYAPENFDQTASDDELRRMAEDFGPSRTRQQAQVMDALKDASTSPFANGIFLGGEGTDPQGNQVLFAPEQGGQTPISRRYSPDVRAEDAATFRRANESFSRVLGELRKGNGSTVARGRGKGKPTPPRAGFTDSDRAWQRLIDSGEVELLPLTDYDLISNRSLKSGAEHDFIHHPDKPGIGLRITQLRSGFSQQIPGKDPVEAYLERLAEQSQIFGGGARFSGVMLRKHPTRPGELYAVVHEVENRILANDQGTIAEHRAKILSWMAGLGFEPVPNTTWFVHRQTGTVVSDLHRNNAPMDESGEIVILDSLFKHLSPEGVGALVANTSEDEAFAVITGSANPAYLVPPDTDVFGRIHQKTLHAPYRNQRSQEEFEAFLKELDLELSDLELDFAEEEFPWAEQILDQGPRENTPQQNRAIPAQDEFGRANVRRLDAIRDLSNPVKSDQSRMEAARKLLEDPERLRQDIESAALLGEPLDDERTYAAMALTQQAWKKAARTGSVRDMVQAAKLTWAYRDTGANVGRAMRARRDWFETPEERNISAVTEFMSRLSPDAERRVMNTPEAKRSEAMESELAKKLKQIEEALAAFGITIEEMIDGQAVAKFRESVVVDNSIKAATANETERKALRLILEGRSNAAISRVTGLTDAKIDALEKRGRETLAEELAKLAERGVEISDLHNLASLDDVPSLTFPAQGPTLQAPERAAMALKGRRVNTLTDAEARAEEIKRRVDLLYGRKEVRAGERGKKVRQAASTTGHFSLANADVAIWVAQQIYSVDGRGFDLAYEWWINSILSGTQTQVVNLVGNTAGLLGEAIHRAVEIPLNMGVRDPRGARLGEIPHALAGLLRGIPMAFSRALRAARFEYNLFEQEMLDESVDLEPLLEKGGGRARISERALAQIFGRKAWNAYQKRFADSLAEQAGLLEEEADMNALKGQAATEWVAKTLAERRAAIEKQALADANAVLDKSTAHRLQRQIDTMPGGWGKLARFLTAGSTVRLPGRLLLFTDTLFKYLIGHAEVGAYAYREAKRKGLTGKALADYIAAQVQTPGSLAWCRAVASAQRMTYTSPITAGLTPAMERSLKARFARVADSEGLTGDQAKERIEQLMFEETQDTRLPGVMQIAASGIAKAKSAEIRHRNRIAQVTLRIAQAVLNFHVPFIGTPYNIGAAAFRKTPIGLLGIASRLVRAEIYRRDHPGLRYWQAYGKSYVLRDLADQVIAWSTFAGLSLLANAIEGDDDDDDKPLLFTGSQPHRLSRSAKREFVERQEGGPMMIRVGKAGDPWTFWIPYRRLDPLATSLAGIVDFGRTYKQTNEPNAAKRALKAGLTTVALASQQGQDKTFLTGLTELGRLYEIVASVGTEAQAQARLAEVLGKNLNRILSGFIPNLIRQPLRELESAVRDTRDQPLVYEYLPLPTGAIETFQGWGLPLPDAPPPKRDLYGNEMIKQHSDQALKNAIRTVLASALEPSPDRDIRAEKFMGAFFRQYADIPTGTSIPARLRDYHYRDAKATTPGKWVEMTPQERDRFDQRSGRRFAAESARLITPRDLANPTPEKMEQLAGLLTKIRGEEKRKMFPSQALWDEFKLSRGDGVYQLPTP